MSFGCPKCGGKGSLCISASMELPPDNRSDEITLQAAECNLCGFSAVSVYEESRRGAIEREASNHVAFPVHGETYEEIRAAIAACAAPRNAACTCSSHIRFSRQDRTGRWVGLDDLALGSGFDMIYFSPHEPFPD